MSACPSCRTAGVPPACPASVDADGRRHCGTCGAELVDTPRNWRPPRRSNKSAWRRVAAGEVLWDRRAVARSAERKAKGTFEERERAAAATRERRRILRAVRLREREQESTAARARRLAHLASRREARRARRSRRTQAHCLCRTWTKWARHRGAQREQGARRWCSIGRSAAGVWEGFALVGEREISLEPRARDGCSRVTCLGRGVLWRGAGGGACPPPNSSPPWSLPRQS